MESGPSGKARPNPDNIARKWLTTEAKKPSSDQIMNYPDGSPRYAAARKLSYDTSRCPNTAGRNAMETTKGAPQDAAATGGGPGEPEASPAIRASDRERDTVVQRVQQAFAEGRLDDAEFDERMRAALTARTHADLAGLLTDPPAETAAPGPAPVTAGRGPGRLAIALKSSVRRGGRWRVPEKYTTVVYKGDGLLHLPAAAASGPVDT